MLFESQPFWQAWQALSNLRLSSRNSIKPGKSVPLVKDVNSTSFQDVRRANQQCSSELNNKHSGQISTHQTFHGSNTNYGESNCMFTSLPSGTIDAAEAGKSRQTEGYSSMFNNSRAREINGSSSSDNTLARQMNGLNGTFPEGMDDDDILEVIHYNCLDG